MLDKYLQSREWKVRVQKLRRFTRKTADLAGAAANLTGDIIASNASPLFTAIAVAPRVVDSLGLVVGNIDFTYVNDNKLPAYAQKYLPDPYKTKTGKIYTLDVDRDIEMLVDGKDYYVTRAMADEALEILSTVVEMNCPRVFAPDVKQIVKPTELVGMHSEKADEICSILEKLYEVTDTRNILLDGSPGVGKSCLAGYIAEYFCGPDDRILIVSACAAKYATQSLGEITKITKPTVVILDDMDRYDNPEAFLPYLQSRPAKLVICTANRLVGETNSVNHAIRRAGRIDQDFIITGESLGLEPDDEILLLDDETQARVSKWARASLTELQLRIRALGVDSITPEVLAELEGKSEFAGAPTMPDMGDDLDDLGEDFEDGAVL